jgi:hypothetical protein
LPGERERRETIFARDRDPASETTLHYETNNDPMSATIGIRIEDDVLITAGEPKVLSAGAARTVKDIEAWMATQR